MDPAPFDGRLRRVLLWNDDWVGGIVRNHLHKELRVVPHEVDYLVPLLLSQGGLSIRLSIWVVVLSLDKAELIVLKEAYKLHVVDVLCASSFQLGLCEFLDFVHYLI